MTLLEAPPTCTPLSEACPGKDVRDRIESLALADDGRKSVAFRRTLSARALHPARSRPGNPVTSSPLAPKEVINFRGPGKIPGGGAAKHARGQARRVGDDRWACDVPARPPEAPATAVASGMGGAGMTN